MLASDRPRPLRPARLAVVEDDREMRRMVASRLREEGYAVTEFEDGDDFIDHFFHLVGDAPVLETEEGALAGAFEPTDLIVSDVRMPGVGGLEILSGLRSLDSDLPVILITAFGSWETHEEALRLGAAAVLDKPFAVDELAALVRRALGGAADEPAPPAR